MRWRLTVWLTYGAAVMFLGAGLALFSAADAFAAGHTSTYGSCDLAVTGPLSTTGGQTFGQTELKCSGMPTSDSNFVSSGGGVITFASGGHYYTYGVFTSNSSCSGSTVNFPSSFDRSGVVTSSPGVDYQVDNGVCIGITYVTDRGTTNSLGFDVNNLFDFVSDMASVTVHVGTGFVNPPCDSPTIAGYVAGLTSNGVAVQPYTLRWAGSAFQIVALDTFATGVTARTIDGKTFYQEQIGGQFAAPISPDAITVTPSAGDSVNPHFWCDTGTAWVDWGTAASMTAYTGPASAACTLQYASGYVGDTSDGTTIFSFVVSFLGGASKIVALDDGAAASGTTSVIAGKSFFADQVNLVDNSPTSPEALSITPASGDLVDPHLWCYTGTAWVDWGVSSTIAGVTSPPGGVENLSPDQCGDGGAFCFVSCFSSTGMSLYNPLSWVTGIAKFTVCGIRWILQPSSSKVTALTNQFGLGSNAPTLGSSSASQWLGAGAYLLAEGPYTSMVAIQTAESSGGCSLLDGSGYATRSPLSLRTRNRRVRGR